ncbi:Na-translocating system protein MpsC family protein [Bacillus sp. FJAT-27251]|uniref:Na-translocating system protein MpsC family protein n=1 Tax=Bacillus sp. FJAT-27251 TaxID=1684142 RepID=UPI000A599A95|nr:Na-translocating system protein MpsC family protein [Bacillus sp. FJAT-27251]
MENELSEKELIEKEIAGFIGRLLRDQFGRGPGGVHCTLSSAFLTVHLTSFLSPMEKSLIERKQGIYVHKTRDLLMERIINEITSFTELTLKKEIDDFY